MSRRDYSNTWNFDARQGSQIRQGSSYRSTRRPIFQNSPFYSNRRTQRQSLGEVGSLHIQMQTVHDDSCGCQHILEPCAVIRSLLVGLNEKNMRAEYEWLEQSSRSKQTLFDLRRKYYRFLPAEYPELYLAQLSNLLANLQEELAFNEFLTLAWIQYHAKYEHITYFLFADLRKARKPRSKFIDQLELLLISKGMDLPDLLHESKIFNLPLSVFLQHYHLSFAANIVPLVHYGEFIKVLLKKGEKSLRILLLLLLTTQKDIFFELLSCYNTPDILQKNARCLNWDDLFQQLLAWKQEK